MILDDTSVHSIKDAVDFTPRVKPWVMQSFLTFDSVDRNLKCDRTIHWKVLALFVFQVCNFGKFINFRLNTVRSEQVNKVW